MIDYDPRDIEPAEAHRCMCGTMIIQIGDIPEETDNDGDGTGVEHECEYSEDVPDTGEDVDEEHKGMTREGEWYKGKVFNGVRWVMTSKRLDDHLERPVDVAPEGVVQSTDTDTEEPAMIVTPTETASSYAALMENDHLDHGHVVRMTDCPLCETYGPEAARPRTRKATAKAPQVAADKPKAPATGRANSSHAECDHESTKAARAKCRRDRQAKAG